MEVWGQMLKEGQGNEEEQGSLGFLEDYWGE